MKRSNSTRRLSTATALGLWAVWCLVALTFGGVPRATAHGSAEAPPSRTHACRFSSLDNEMCAQAWAAEPQALYDWMEVNIGDAAGDHLNLIPDGQLCSAGREKYAAFDEPGDWPTTGLKPDSDGLTTVQFFATAPHAAEYFRFYLTREGFDPLTDRLTWGDLELVHDSGQVPYSELAAEPHHPFRFALPEREGRQILYLVWQRSDSPEAFYGCSDVVLGSAEGPTESSNPEPPVEPTPESSNDPVAPAPGLDDIEVDLGLTDDWGGGACGEGTVTNYSNNPVAWEVYVEMAGTVTSHWDSVMSLSTHPHGHDSAIGQNWRVIGAPWNAILEPGGSTGFGFCIDRTVSAHPMDDPEDPVGDSADTGDLPAETPNEPAETNPSTDEESPAVAEEPTPETNPSTDEEAPVVAEGPAPETGPAPGTTGSDGDPILAAYFPEWGIYGRDYRIADVPASELTHIIYAFANLDSNGDITLFDPYAATEKRFAANQSVSGVAGATESTASIQGNFGQIALLKERYPHLRASIAVGGWTLSGYFSSALSTAEGREYTSDSLIEFLERYDMFDGVDFDWEYPGGGGLSGNGSSSQDGTNYALFLELVREKLDVLANATGHTYQISVASPAGLTKIENFNLPELTNVVDFFNVMTYDFHGAWEDVTGHLAAFEGDPAGYDISTTIRLYLEAGVPREKIVLGSPLYTRAWSGVAEGDDGGYAEAAAGAAPGSFWDQNGMYDYKDLLGQLQANNSSWRLYWDDDAQAAYLYDPSQQIFSSFETPGSVALKSEWAQHMGLGGMMFWDLSSDATGQPESLLTAAFGSWYRGLSFDQIVSASDVEFDQILGGNGRFDPIAEADTLPTDLGDPEPEGAGNETSEPAGTDEAPEPNPEADEEAGTDPEPEVNESTDSEGDTGPGEGEESAPSPSEEPLGLENISVEVGGSRWWNGFSAELTVYNETESELDTWSFRFRSSHSISGAPWGIEITTSDLGNGLFEHRVTGANWASNIPVGGSVLVGFNGQQGTPIGNEGPLTAEQVFDGGLVAD